MFKQLFVMTVFIFAAGSAFDLFPGLWRELSRLCSLDIVRSFLG